MARVDRDDFIALDELQRDALLPQIGAFISAAPNDAARSTYDILAHQIAELKVSASSAETLGKMLEVLLSTGRTRNLYGPGAALALWSLFQKTPPGRAMLASVDSLNTALAPLAGAHVESITAAARGPAAYALILRTERLQMVLRFEPAGVRVESIELGPD